MVIRPKFVAAMVGELGVFIIRMVKFCLLYNNINGINGKGFKIESY
jgi:hypothetical protein